MNTASVAELKARLSEFLAKVKQGHDVIITDRGKPVARLTALPDATRVESHWSELVRTGGMMPGRGKLPADFLYNMPEDRAGAVLKALLEEREEGW